METKLCGKCKIEKPVSEFYKSTRDGYRSRCKVCHRDDCAEYGANGYYKRYAKDYYNRPEVIERVKSYKKEYRKRPDVMIKNFARHYLNQEVISGRINREPCAFCGKEQVEAHHPNYNHPLIIVWLCPDCHRMLHPKESTLKEKDAD